MYFSLLAINFEVSILLVTLFPTSKIYLHIYIYVYMKRTRKLVSIVFHLKKNKKKKEKILERMKYKLTTISNS